MFLKFLPTIFTWWLYILLMTLIFLPIAHKYLKLFPGSGYAFAKAMGITFPVLGSFLLAYLKILPFGKAGIFVFPILIILLDIWIICDLKFRKKETFGISSRNIIEMFAIEGLFFIGLLACAYMRSQQPDLLGLEKFMDYGFVKSILRSTYMPAADMWLSGATINYYYFGQYICAALSVMTMTAADVSYNMMLAVIFGETLILSYSLGAGLYSMGVENQSKGIEVISTEKNTEKNKVNNSYKNIILAGVITMFLLTLGGNLHSFVYGYAFPLAEKAGIKATVPNATAYYYPDSTRFIGYAPDTSDKTITEFPSYSAVVADLHGHVSDIPHVLLFMGFSIAIAKNFFRGSAGKKNTYALGLPILSGALLGAMFMTNAWDFPIYLTLCIILILFCNIRYIFAKSSQKEISANVLNSVISVSVMLTVAIAVIIPFLSNFQNFSSGIGLVRSHSPLWQLFMLWGHFWIITLPFVGYTLFGIWKYFFSKRDIKGKDSNFLEFTSGKMLLLLLILCGYGLLLIPEVVYVRDIYEQGYHRANTMFKVTYQAFIILAVCCGPAFVNIYVSLKSFFVKRGKKSFIPFITCTLIFLIAVAAPMLFMFKAVPGYYGSLKPSHVVGLQGTDFLKVQYKSDHEIIDWLNVNVKGQPVILEAPGASYSPSGRISSMTGLPTVIGWNVHEWLWRNSNDVPTGREEEVVEIYSGTDPSRRLELIKKYNIKYIIISDLEKEKYPEVMDSGILDFGDIVFKEAGDSVILKTK